MALSRHLALFLFSARAMRVEIKSFVCRVRPAERSKKAMMKIFISDAVVSRGYDGV